MIRDVLAQEGVEGMEAAQDVLWGVEAPGQGPSAGCPFPMVLTPGHGAPRVRAGLASRSIEKPSLAPAYCGPWRAAWVTALCLCLSFLFILESGSEMEADYISRLLFSNK